MRLNNPNQATIRTGPDMHDKRTPGRACLDACSAVRVGAISTISGDRPGACGFMYRSLCHRFFDTSSSFFSSSGSSFTDLPHFGHSPEGSVKQVPQSGHLKSATAVSPFGIAKAVCDSRHQRDLDSVTGSVHRAVAGSEAALPTPCHRMSCHGSPMLRGGKRWNCITRPWGEPGAPSRADLTGGRVQCDEQWQGAKPRSPRPALTLPPVRLWRPFRPSQKKQARYKRVIGRRAVWLWASLPA